MPARKEGAVWPNPPADVLGHEPGRVPRPTLGPAGEACGPLSERDAEAYVASTCFKTGPPGAVGVELEWFVLDRAAPTTSVPLTRLSTAIAPFVTGRRSLPARGLLTQEPGGQLELSSQPASTLSDCLTDVRADLDALRGTLASAGLALHGAGLDPLRDPCRVVDVPRYRAMETFFDRSGTDGRTMMCSTASVQVCLDAGRDDESTAGFRSRWRLLHALGPVLVAAFANSPLRANRPTGWRSTRQAVWTGIDPGRTRAVLDGSASGNGAGTANGRATGSPTGNATGSGNSTVNRAVRNGAAGYGVAEPPDPREMWARYALDAQVLCIRTSDGPWLVPSGPNGLTFRQWVRTGRPRPPTTDDLVYHLSTLFPPVRPRGWVELRMIDAQPGDDWVVPVAVVTSLLEDPVAAELAAEAVEALQPARPSDDPHGAALWERAARFALSDEPLARATQRCFEVAMDALPRLGAGTADCRAVADYHDRYVHRRRTPADDRLAEWRRGTVPSGEEPIG